MHVKDKIDKVLHGYLVAALWTDTDNSDESGGDPLDANYDLDDIADKAKRKARAAIVQFMRANKATIAAYIEHRRYSSSDGSIYEHLGHDLWLTRNHHGTGFWDRDYGGRDEIGKALTKAAHDLGEQDAIVGDDDQVYLEGGC